MKKHSFDKLINSYLLFKKNEVKESTLSCYLNLINNYIRPSFGKYMIEEINSDMINIYTDFLKEKKHLSNKYIREILQLILNIFKYAKEFEFKANLQISFPKVKNKEITIFSTKDISTLKTYILQNLNTKTFGILFCLFTGLRIGEVCALKWKDIDLELKNIIINKTLIRIKNTNNTSPNKTKVIISTPKTEASNRVIPLPSFLIDYLVQLKENDDFYFLTNQEKYIEPANYYFFYAKILTKAKIKHQSFHTLRHTFATKCIENNFDVKLLSEILGHSNINITLTRYVHSSMEYKRASMEKLASFFEEQ